MSSPFQHRYFLRLPLIGDTTKSLQRHPNVDSYREAMELSIQSTTPLTRMDEAWQVKARRETKRPTQHRFDVAAQGNLASLSDIRVLPSAQQVLRFVLRRRYMIDAHCCLLTWSLYINFCLGHS